MKYENLIYGIGTLVIIAGALAKIMHWPYGNFLFILGFSGMSLYQSAYISKLKKRIRDLENNQ